MTLITIGIVLAFISVMAALTYGYSKLWSTNLKPHN